MSTPTRRICCARAASGHAVAAPPSSEMNSRRLMCCPQSEDCTLSHRGRKCRVVHYNKFGGQCRSWVISLGSDRGRGPVYVRGTSDRVEILCSALKDAKCHEQTTCPCTRHSGSILHC